MSDLGVTSGPLKVFGFGGGYEVNRGDLCIAYFHTYPDHYNVPALANARAFVEAPAMIKVLQQLVAGDTVNIDEVREILARIENF